MISVKLLIDPSQPRSTFPITYETMGTDIYPILTVRQLENREEEPENVEDIVDAIETEFGKSFEDNGESKEYTADGYSGMRWSNMVDDMTEFSKQYPGILFGIRYEWPDNGSEYMEWFENGRHYCDERPKWEPIFKEAKFLKNANAK